jgi:hypothetical protein
MWTKPADASIRFLSDPTEAGRAQATHPSESGRLSHSPILFELANVRATNLRGLRNGEECRPTERQPDPTADETFKCWTIQP